MGGGNTQQEQKPGILSIFKYLDKWQEYLCFYYIISRPNIHYNNRKHTGLKSYLSTWICKISKFRVNNSHLFFIAISNALLWRLQISDLKNIKTPRPDDANLLRQRQNDSKFKANLGNLNETLLKQGTFFFFF